MKAIDWLRKLRSNRVSNAFHARFLGSDLIGYLENAKNAKIASQRVLKRVAYKRARNALQTR